MHSVGTSVRCFEPAPGGRVGTILASRLTTGHSRYLIEWTDGKTPTGYPTTTWVGHVNVIATEGAPS